MNFEILAPAGSREALVAGVRSGANAVYFGGKTLNARRNAGNFDNDELAQAVEYCLQRGVKAYLTVNTLCKNGELEDAYRLVDYALFCGISGFIVQDLGVASMIRQCFPQARLHASTQMSVSTPAGVNELCDMGFSRIVLPRELSFDEIKEIRKSTSAELEIFVHGALCMSVSGQCRLSAMLGSRSGNRGLCAQPCRLSFSAANNGGFDLSLKDLSLINRLSRLDELGVTSLKIEGRMKRPEYVSAAVTALKKAINGEYNAEDEKTLKSVFSRSGFTQGYFDGKRNSEMFGIRQKDDVVAAAPVLKEISHNYDNENPLVPMDMHFICKSGVPAVLNVCALGKSVSVTGAIPEKAINKPLTAEDVRARLAKLGSTQFYAGSITADIDEGLSLSAAAINALRREAVDKINVIEKKSVEKLPLPKTPQGKPCSVSYYTARFADASQIPDKHPFRRVFIPVWSSVEDFVDNRAGVEIPKGLFGSEQRLRGDLKRLKRAGVSAALCSSLDACRIAREEGFEVYGDYGLNIFNSLSAGQINSPILSFELTLDEIGKIGAEDKGVIAYGRLPLMLTRNCPVKNSVGCEKCRKNGKLTDRKGIEFSVACSPYPCAEVLNSRVLYMGDRMNEISASFAHFYFTDESKKEVEKIISLYQNGSKADFEYTRGLYYRGVY